MKKIILLVTIIATISNNNTSGMLLRHIKPTPQQRLIPRKQFNPQRRTICILPPDAVKPNTSKTQNAQPRKNIFNIKIDYSEPKEEIWGHLEDLHDRDENLRVLLDRLIEHSRTIAKVLQRQQDLAIDHTFNNEPLNIGKLIKKENELKDLLKIHFTICAQIQRHASCLEIQQIEQVSE